MLEHAGDGVGPIAAGGEELLEVERVHLVVGLVSHAVALDLPVADSEHRAAADDVKAPVGLEELEGAGDLWELLDFVEEQQRLAGLEALRRVEQRDVLDDARGIVPVVADALVLGFLDEVDLDEAAVSPVCEPLNGGRLAYLARPLHDEGKPVGGGLPIVEKGVYLALEVKHEGSSKINGLSGTMQKHERILPLSIHFYERVLAHSSHFHERIK